MRTVFTLILCLFIGLISAGCGERKADSPQAAISKAEAMQSVEEKVIYLVAQAQAFYNSDDFQNAVEIGQYILSNLDKNNQDAKSLIEKAQNALKEKASGALSDIGKKWGN